MARLTTAQRNAAPHAGPGTSFPIPDITHARLAVQMAGHAANPAAVKAKVHRLFPSVAIGGRQKSPQDYVHEELERQLGGGR